MKNFYEQKTAVFSDSLLKKASKFAGLLPILTVYICFSNSTLKHPVGKNLFSTISASSLPSKLNVIGANAFYGCKKLTTVTIGKNVTKIGDKAFYKCTKLKKITIPSNVSSIGKQAFYGCGKLKTITIKTTKLTTKKVGSNAFKGIYSKATIKVPKKKLSAATGQCQAVLAPVISILEKTGI